MAVFRDKVFNPGMCTIVPKTIKEELLRWVSAIARKEIKLVEVVKVAKELWRGGWRPTERPENKDWNPSRQAPPKETPIWVKERVLDLRKRSRLSALKLHWKLEKQGINVKPRVIGMKCSNYPLIKNRQKRAPKTKSQLS